MALILVVDDDEPLRTMLCTTIESWGHEVIAASNGAEAITAFIQQPTEVLLTDLMMPKKDGLNTIERVRKEYPATKIIAMSGGLAHGPAAFLELAQQLGADQVLKKPFSKDELRKALTAVLTANPAGGPSRKGVGR